MVLHMDIDDSITKSMFTTLYYKAHHSTYLHIIVIKQPSGLGLTGCVHVASPVVLLCVHVMCTMRTKHTPERL